MEIITESLLTSAYIIYAMSNCLVEVRKIIVDLTNSFEIPLNKIPDFALSEKIQSYKTFEMIARALREIDFVKQRDGIDITEDEKSVLACKSNALRKTEFFIKQIGINTTKNEVTDALFEFANRNEPKACLTLGYLLLNGLLLEKNENKGLYYIDKGIKLGDLASTYLGIKYNEKKRDDYLLSLNSLFDCYSMPVSSVSIFEKYDYPKKNFVREEIRILKNRNNEKCISNEELEVLYSNLEEEVKEQALENGELAHVLSKMPINYHEPLEIKKKMISKQDREVNQTIEKNICNQNSFLNATPLLLFNDSFSIEKSIEQIKEWLEGNYFIEKDCSELSQQDCSLTIRNFFLKEMSKSIKYPVIILRNVDKINFECIDGLHYFLSKNKRSKFYLQDLGVELHVENAVIILTSNNVNLVPDQIKAVSSLIELPLMSEQSKLSFLTNKINEMLKDTKVKISMENEFTDVIGRYSYDEILDKVKAIITNKMDIESKENIYIKVKDMDIFSNKNTYMGFRI